MPTDNNSSEQLTYPYNASLEDIANYDTFGDVLHLLDEYGQLHLHAKNPNGPDTSMGYHTGIHHHADGQIIASATADKKHEHWGVYTREYPCEEDDDSRIKRISVQGGAKATEISTYSPEGENQFWQNASDNVRHVMVAGDDCKINWLLDTERNALRLHDFSTGDLLSIGVNDKHGELGGTVGERINELETKVAEYEKRLSELESKLSEKSSSTDDSSSGSEQ